MKRIERVIDGVLCWRGADGYAWREYKASELTAALMSARAELEAVDGALVLLRARIDSALSPASGMADG